MSKIWTSRSAVQFSDQKSVPKPDTGLDRLSLKNLFCAVQMVKTSPEHVVQNPKERRKFEKLQ